MSIEIEDKVAVWERRNRVGFPQFQQLPPLSPRQFQLLNFICTSPMSDRDMASLMNISCSTLRTHYQELLSALGLIYGASKTELIASLIGRSMLAYPSRLPSDNQLLK